MCLIFDDGHSSETVFVPDKTKQVTARAPAFRFNPRATRSRLTITNPRRTRSARRQQGSVNASGGQSGLSIPR